MAGVQRRRGPVARDLRRRLWFAEKKGWRWPVWPCGGLPFLLADLGRYVALWRTLDRFQLPLALAVLAWCASPSLRDAPSLERKLPRELTSSTGAVVATFATAMIVYSSALMAPPRSRAPKRPFIRPKWPGVGDLDEGAEFHAQGPVRQDLLARRAPGQRHALDLPRPALLDGLSVTRPAAQGPSRGPADEHETRHRGGGGRSLPRAAQRSTPFHRYSRLTHVKNFYFVTGKLATVKKVWASYGIGVSMTKSDVMSIHSTICSSSMRNTS